MGGGGGGSSSSSSRNNNIWLGERWFLWLGLQAVEDLCVHKMAGKLYHRLQQECETHIAAKLRSLLVGQSPDAVVFLSHVESCWQDHCDQMLVIRSIALYLDRTYVIQNSGVRSLWDMGLQLFRRHLSACSEVESKTVSGLLRLVEKERWKFNSGKEFEGFKDWGLSMFLVGNIIRQC